MDYDLVGQTLEERFTVRALLGQGGMGRVYLAWDEHLLRRVVVKVPHERLLASARVVRRFRREVLSLAKLEHPHIVRILHAGLARSVPYLVMEYLGGGTLLHRFNRGDDLDPSNWLPGIAAALDYIHARQVVHRDVKPGNILFDEKGRACLADFGLVKVLRAQSLDATGTGLAPGSVDYMAPEQATGETVTGATDQYALATILYASFGGRVPYGTGTPFAIIKRKLEQPPPPLRPLAQALSASACAVVERGLSTHPRDRFASCRALAEALAEARAGVPAPVPAKRPRPRARARRFVRLIRLLAVGAVLAGAVALFTLRSRTPDESKRQVPEEVVAANPPPVQPTDEETVPAAPAPPTRRTVAPTEEPPPPEPPLSVPQPLPDPPPVQKPTPEAPEPDDSVPPPDHPAPRGPWSPAERCRQLLQASREARDRQLALLLARAALEAADTTDGRGLLWEYSSFGLDRTPRPGDHADRIVHAVLGPEGSHVVTSSSDGSARVWTLEGEPVAVLGGHDGTVNHADMNRDGQLLTAGEDGTVRLWSLEGEPLASLDLEYPVLAAWFATGDRVVSVSRREFRSWNPSSGEKAASPSRVEFTGAALGHGGESVVAWTRDGRIRAWAHLGNPIAAFKAHEKPIRDAALSDDGRRILTASEDGTAILWNLEGDALRRLERDGSVLSCAFAAGDDRHVTGDVTRALRIAGPPGAAEVTSRLRGAVSSVDVAPDGWIVGAAGWRARLLDAKGNKRASLRGHRGAVVSARFSPDGRHVLTRSLDGDVRLWNREGRCLRIFRGGMGSLREYFRLRGGRRILVTYTDRVALVFDVAGGTARRIDEYTHIAIHPDGERLAVARADGVALVGLEEGGITQTLDDAEDVRELKLSEDGTRLLARGPAGRAPRLHFLDHAGSRDLGKDRLLRDVTFARATAYVLTFEESGCVRLWDSDGRFVTDFGGAALEGARFSASGRHVLTVAEGSFDVWSLRGKRRASFQRKKHVRMSFVGGREELYSHVGIHAPNGRLLVSVAFPTIVRGHVESDVLLVHTTGSPPRLIGLDGEVRGVLPTGNTRFVDGGTRVLVEGDSALSVWTTGGRMVSSCAREGEEFTSVSVLPNGAGYLVTTRTHGMHLLDAKCAIVATARPQDPVLSAKVDAVGRVITRHASNRIRLWPPGLERARASTSAGITRDFTEAERRRFAHLLPPAAGR